MAEEVELKYEIDDPEAVIALLDHELPAAEETKTWLTHEVADRYFDTADRALARAGYGARLRREGSQTTVAIKADAQVDGALVRRFEAEGPATAELDLAAWPDSDAKTLIARLVGTAPLVERFVLRQQRQRRLVGGLELSIDAVSVRRRRRELGRLSELEIELDGGRKSDLRKVARLVERSGLAKPEPRSKMALAAAIVEGPPPLYPADPLAEAGRKVLARLLERLLEREAAMRSGETLALKQMRVTTRRMRATWRSFDGAYRRTEQRGYVEELRGVARQLGAVRDLDVLLEKLPADNDLNDLREAWRARREAAWQQLLGVLDSRDYARFVTDYQAFARSPGAAATRRGATLRVVGTAGSRVWAAYEAVRAAQPPSTGEVEPADLHAMRIAARQFRYTLEAFRDLLDDAATTQLLARLVKMQDVLGELNDADVAAREVGSWISAQTSASAAVEAYRARLLDDVGRLARSVGPVVDGVAGLTFRRLLGRAVAAI